LVDVKKLSAQIIRASIPLIAQYIQVKNAEKSLSTLESLYKGLEAASKPTTKVTLDENLKASSIEPTHVKEGKDDRFIKTVEYTRKMAIKHLILVEDHLRASEREVCDPCLVEKHFPALRGYAEEGLNYYLSDREKEAYKRLLELVSRAEIEIKNGTADYLKLADEFREIRKMLSSPEVAALETLSQI